MALALQRGNRNLALLERYLARPAATRAASRGLLVGILLALAGLAAGGVTLTIIVLRALV